MHKLYEWACTELEELEQKTEKGLSAADVEYADKLTELKKNILKIEMLEDEGYSAEYRDDMGNYARGRNRGSYNSGSYRNSYARGRNARRDSMGRYSSMYYDGEGDIVDKLHDLMAEAPDEKTKAELKKFIAKMETMA